MPSLFEVRIRMGDAGVPAGEHVHAMVSTWLEAHRSLEEHRANTKPFRIGRLGTSPTGDTVMRVALLDDSLFEVFTQATEAAAHSIRLGRSHGHLVPVETGRPWRLVEAATWEELLKAAAPVRDWQFRCWSPTAFRSNKVVNPLPVPTLIFGHLRNRWSAFAPEDLQPALDLRPCELTVRHLNGHTEVFSWRRNTYPGFVGELTVHAAGGEQRDHRVLDALARFVTFAGVGSNTTAGMGDVELLTRE